MFRHGARYHLYPLYDYKTTERLRGELTAVGMRNHENLGKMLRKDYIEELHFLSESYQVNQIEVFSTNANRTFDSATSQLYGLYPLGNGVKLPEVDPLYHLPPYSQTTDSDDKSFSLPLGYQNIPVTINTDVLLTSCPLISHMEQQNQLAQLQIFKEMNMTYYPFMVKMGNLFNTTTFNFSEMVGIYDTALVDKYLGRPMPETFKQEDYINLQHLTYWYGYFQQTFNLSKALNTNVIKRVLRDFDDRIEHLSEKELRWTFLSAHDSNLFALTNDLNISSSSCVEEKYRKGKTDALNCQPGPQFAASLIFELHSDDDTAFYVKLRYNGKYVFLCEKQSLTCDYKEWKSRASEIILDNVYEVCHGSTPKTYEAKITSAY